MSLVKVSFDLITLYLNRGIYKETKTLLKTSKGEIKQHIRSGLETTLISCPQALYIFTLHNEFYECSRNKQQFKEVLLLFPYKQVQS